MENKETKHDSEIRKANLGTQTFEKFCNQQPWCKVDKFSQKKYDKWDVSYLNKGEKTLGEIKVRKEIYDDYILELDKLAGLKQIQQKLLTRKGINANITYINHLPGNITFVWDLTRLDLTKYKIFEKELPKNDYDSTLVMKRVIYLHNCDAQKFETDEQQSIFNTNQSNDDDDDIEMERITRLIS